MIIDFVIPNPKQPLLEAYDAMARLGREGVPADYSFHVAVTWWRDQVHEDMGVLRATTASTASSTSWPTRAPSWSDDEMLVEQLHALPRAGRHLPPCTPRTASWCFTCSRKS